MLIRAMLKDLRNSGLDSPVVTDGTAAPYFMKRLLNVLYQLHLDVQAISGRRGC